MAVNGLPGVPLSTGFGYRPAAERPDCQLSPEARRRIDKMIDSVRRSRARSEAAARSAAVCG